MVTAADQQHLHGTIAMSLPRVGDEDGAGRRTGVDGEGEGGREDGDRARDRMLLVFLTTMVFLTYRMVFFNVPRFLNNHDLKPYY
jgi:hypothetical protein